MRIYDFAKGHLMPSNAVIVMSITVAAMLDFLAPQAAHLSWLSYALAGLVVVIIVLELFHRHIGVNADSSYARFLVRLRPMPGPAWSSPGWQVVGTVAVVALVLGCSSKSLRRMEA